MHPADKKLLTSPAGICLTVALVLFVLAGVLSSAVLGGAAAGACLLGFYFGTFGSN